MQDWRTGVLSLNSMIPCCCKVVSVVRVVEEEFAHSHMSLDCWSSGLGTTRCRNESSATRMDRARRALCPSTAPAATDCPVVPALDLNHVQLPRLASAGRPPARYHPGPCSDTGRLPVDWHERRTNSFRWHAVRDLHPR